MRARICINYLIPIFVLFGKVLFQSLYYFGIILVLFWNYFVLLLLLLLLIGIIMELLYNLREFERI